MSRLLVFSLGLLGLLPGCGPADGVLLELTADGAWNSEAQVAGSLDSVQVLFDAQGGFAASGDGHLVDPDGDGEDELLVILDVAGRTSLPTVRIRANRSAQQAMAVRLRGMDAQGQVVAYGGVPAQQIFDGLDRISVPLDLRRSQRPAYLIALSPASVPADSSLSAVAMFTSRPLDPDSVSANVRVSLDGEGELAGGWTSREDCPDGAQMWTFSPSQCLAVAGGMARIEVAFRAGLSDLVGEPVDPMTAQLDLALTEFGACQPMTGCSALGSDVVRPDLRCDTDSGLFEPAPCSNAPGACVGERNAYGTVSVTDPQACQAYRPGAEAVDGVCVIMDAWPCMRQSDCRDIGAFACDFATGLCQPDSCLDACPTPGQVCVPEWGCQPGLGACLEPCAAYGSCPDFSQACLMGDDGLWACRSGEGA